MAKTSVSQTLKDQNQQKTVLVLTFLGLLYGVVFLPPSVLGYLGLSLSSIEKIIGGGALLGLIGAILGYSISAQDLLATGRNEAAEFYRSQYPSNSIVSKYNCTQAQADELWFQVFNPWVDIPPRMEYYTKTFERGLACRFIVLVRRALVVFFVASLVTWGASRSLIQIGRPVESTELWVVFARILLLSLALVLSWSLYRWNRVPRKGQSTPTGCWYRWQEINGMTRTWLENEVLQQASRYSDALQLVASGPWKAKHGYP